MEPKPFLLLLFLFFSFAVSEVAPEEVAESLCAGGQSCPVPHGSNSNSVLGGWTMFQMSLFKMLFKREEKKRSDKLDTLTGFSHLHLKRLDVLFLKCNILFNKRI